MHTGQMSPVQHCCTGLYIERLVNLFHNIKCQTLCNRGNDVLIQFDIKRNPCINMNTGGHLTILIAEIEDLNANN